jgi:UDP-N-acetylmuramoyl-L-alanyl-D-glutamate--2,6-diaminopimelate ligase
MLRKIKSLFPANHPLRMWWHRSKARTACIVYRNPSKKMTVIGITGTNGKTTTTTLTTKILEKAGHKVGMASTVGFKIDREEWQNTTHKTTLGPFQLQKILSRMVKAGCDVAVIETSSHALSQYRVHGVNYDVVAITNVTPEHLDYHRSMRAYRQEKLKLFEQLSGQVRKPGQLKISIHNVDDPDNFDAFMQYESDKKIGYGVQLSEDDRLDESIRASDVSYSPEHTNLTLHTPKEKMNIKYYLPGEFNVENLLAASSIAYALGASLKDVKAACDEVKLIPGRLESIKEGQNYQVFIDFAITEDGFEKVLNALRKVTENNIWVVFGCCGDRDQKKRPKIGEICGELADKVIVCDDEPYTEDPKVIRDMILEGVEHSKLNKDEDFFEIPDRAEAIEFACKNAQAGDTIVIPGMGDLEGRTFADGIRPWNEREEVRKILKKIHQPTAV